MRRRRCRARPGRRTPITYAGNNRTHMIRIPDAGRFELRLADGAANPYLLQAALLVCRPRRHPQQARSGQAARHRHVHARATRSKGAKRLPLNLLDALRAFEKSDVLRDGLGEDFVEVIPQAQARRLERLFAPPDRLGTADDAGLLKLLRSTSVRLASVAAAAR